jgi:tRNA(fMet)-specific endonuclease VapC
LTLLIDTSVAVAMRDGIVEVVTAITARAEPLAISVLTLAELAGGLAGPPQVVEPRRARQSALLRHVDCLILGPEIVEAYAGVLAASGFSRRKIVDRLIAATALVHALPLATLNPDDFADVPGLRLMAWAPPQ